jgi:hypothetical protein
MSNHVTRCSVAWLAAVLSMGGLGASNTLLAGELYRESFDSLALGAIDGQDGWNGSSGVEIVQDQVSVEGRALLLEGGTDASIRRPGITGDTSRIIEFDLLLDRTIADYPQLRNTYLQTYVSKMLFDAALVSLRYRGEVDSEGDIRFSRFTFNMLESADSPEVEANVWYHVRFLMDADGHSGRVIMDRGGQPWWDSGSIPADLISPMPPSGYRYDFYLENTSTAGSPINLLVDNVRATEIPEPTSLMLLGGSGLILLRRRF